MKKRTRLILTSLLTCFILCEAVSAASLSPGLQVIAKQYEMVKTGTVHGGVSFTKEDFLRAASLSEIDSVTVTSLPAAASGSLYLGSTPLAVNQSISGENLDKLRFVPASGAQSSAFSFSSGGGYSIRCVLRITDEVNLSPAVSAASDDISAWTQQDISCFGSLKAYDPEGDPLYYEILSYPEKGLLTLTDSSHGDFRYTPYLGCSGEDSFVYRVRDSYGNYSDPAPVRVQISRKNNTLVFSDMKEHWAHSAAIEMAADGIIDYSFEGDAPVFLPEQAVTREEFLVMLMKAAGFESSRTDAVTVFADDSDIRPENKVYIRAAYNAGIVRGKELGGKICFCPTEPLTRAEAAVMLNNIIGAEVPVNKTLFSDDAAVPAWAKSALYALNDLKILSGTGSGSISPAAQINRAQAAQILFNFTQYIK